ncbi:hypothetical protein BU14_0105s0035 [Porphyra umbilicalis]|uniref:Uncharacterized protein n=1 Tax=Porphyra umbilicalis TaxID=2786 RepID=A0A1X6PCM1_PORUM|nr:hypothetical protein BU14_0105s0035 [Porphyra umbilicalis]|eukprot:OSX78617.1 hypothetical protein BU14_0105s0035 [Porphyra umbilicalis]
MQTRLLRRALSPEALGKADFALLLRYVGGMRGGGAQRPCGKRWRHGNGWRWQGGGGGGGGGDAGAAGAGAPDDKAAARVRKRARKLVRVLRAEPT